MSITIEKAAEISEEQIVDMLDFDNASALSFINAQLKDLETEHRLTTREMLEKFADTQSVESHIRHWQDLLAMKKDLESYVTGT